MFLLSEKMDKSNEGLKEESTENSRDRGNILVISIDRNGRIIQFNKECEKITGYSKHEALNKEFFDFLIPESYFGEWERLFDLARRDQTIDDLTLPWLTSLGHEVMISWNIFPVEKVEGSMGEICLVGRLVVPDYDSKEPLPKDIQEGTEDTKSIIEFIKAGIDDRSNVTDKSDIDEKDPAVFTLGNKRVILKKSSSVSPPQTGRVSKKKISSKIEEKKEPIKVKPVKFKELPTKPVKTKSVKTIKEKKVKKSGKPPEKSYRNIDKTIEKLVKKNLQLEAKNKQLEKDLKKLQARQLKIEKKEDKSDETHTAPLRKSLYSLSDILGGKRKREELERIMNELEEKRILLDKREIELNNEKKSINKRRDEFLKWREKLELLENEIESRRKEIADQEKMFSSRISSYLEDGSDKPADLDREPEYEVNKDEETSEITKPFDEILESAAIVQRGILKQVNNSFIELLGYSMDELVEKSLLDFVVQEGLSGIEKYYLNKLKGESTSSFETVFLTKDEDRLAVEIRVTPTLFNGEKAEIVVVKNPERLDK